MDNAKILFFYTKRLLRLQKAKIKTIFRKK